MQLNLETSVGPRTCAAHGSASKPQRVFQQAFTFAPSDELTNRRLGVSQILPATLGSLKRKVGVADDGRRYVMLHNDAKPGVALNEYLCSKLAEEFGAPVTPFTILDSNGTPHFGSRYVCGKLSLSRLSVERYSPESLGYQLSSIYAIDQLLGNTDRNLENLFFLREDDRVVVEGIDFSQAGFYGEDWTSNNLLRDGSDTAQTFQSLFPDFHQNTAAMLSVLDKAHRPLPRFWDAALQKIPQAWRNQPAVIDSWIDWWTNHRPRRAEALYNLVNCRQ